MKSELVDCLRATLEHGLDESLLKAGFARRKNALVYARKLAESVQKIEVALEIHPRERPDSVAAVYPWMKVNVDAVNQLVLEMGGGDLSLLQGVTLEQPIEFTSAKAAHARWYVFQPDSVSHVVGEMKSFLQQWTIPFLDLYASPAGICEAYDRADARTIIHHARVAAAMVLCGRTPDALSVMERWFGRPGPRKQYKRVFDYLNAVRDRAE